MQSCQREAIAKICADFNNEKGELINVLHRVQGEFGYLPEEVQREIAKNLNMPVSKVYGVVTFYSYFTMTPKGKYPISVCLGTACYVRGSEKILDKLQSEVGLAVGGVSADGKFSLDCLRCVGACGLAPVMLIGDKVYGRVEASQIPEILASYE
ncbi:MAG: NAD(P)H-dependent oxidoreductase subunit E [Rikenellaceae bacterium]